MELIIFALLMSNKDLNIKLKQVLYKALEEKASKNLPLVYRNRFCTKENQFIHAYPNGRKVLIQQDPKTSVEKVIKEF